MVEIFFGIITRQCLKRGTFSSVPVLQDAMERYIEHENRDARPFRWTKSVDHLLGKMQRTQIINTQHYPGGETSGGSLVTNMPQATLA